MYWGDRPRRHRERRYCPDYPPYSYYEDSDGYESIERYSYATRRSKRALCPPGSGCICNGDFREPFETLSCYDPFEEHMDFVHRCIIAMNAGRLIAQDAADRIEELSKMINRTYGYDPTCRNMSRFFKQVARDAQLLPDHDPYWSRRPRGPTSYWYS